MIFIKISLTAPVAPAARIEWFTKRGKQDEARALSREGA